MRVANAWVPTVPCRSSLPPHDRPPTHPPPGKWKATCRPVVLKRQRAVFLSWGSRADGNDWLTRNVREHRVRCDNYTEPDDAPTAYARNTHARTHARMRNDRPDRQWTRACICKHRVAAAAKIACRLTHSGSVRQVHCEFIACTSRKEISRDLEREIPKRKKAAR